MNPSAYPGVYWAIPVWFADGTSAAVPVRNYLQHGLGEQSKRAQAAKQRLTSAIARDKIKADKGGVYRIDGREIGALSIERVFMGKGAPDEIQDVLWLAGRYGLTDAGSVGTYADRNIGMDCGGFVACLWGIGKPLNGSAVQGSTGFKPRSFWNFDRSKRRARVDDIAIGDAIIFFSHMKGDDTDLASTDPALGGEAYHIGAVGGVTVKSGAIDLGIMESSGAQAVTGGDGVNYRISYDLPIKTAKGLVYGDAGQNAKKQGIRLYFVGKAGNCVPYLPNGISYEGL